MDSAGARPVALSSSTAPSAAGPASKGNGPFCRLARVCAAHGATCLALIIVLILVIVALYVYYHGILSFGPYASGAAGGLMATRASSRGGARATASRRKKADDGGPPDEKTDSETEKLIDTINSQ